MEGSLKLTRGQVEFLMSKFGANDPNEAIDYLIELMILEGADPMNAKYFIMRMMQEELKTRESERC
jgi:hypothetical protein